MTKLEDIEKAVKHLSREDFARFEAWFDELREQMFDERLEQGIREGKFDKLAEQALANHKAGKSRKLPGT